MENNILFVEQDIFTLTPLLFACLLGMMIITGKWKRDIILTVYLAIDGLCTSIMLFGYWQEAFVMVDVSSVVVVFYSIFRRRIKCGSK